MTRQSPHAFVIATAVIAVLIGGLGLQARRVQPSVAARQVESELQRTISVNGQGSSAATPDQAVVRLGVQTEAETATAAIAGNNQQVLALLGALSEGGLSDQDVQTEVVQLQPRYRAQLDAGEQQLTGYVATNIVQARVREISRLGELLDAAVQAGSNRIEGIGFEFSDPSMLLESARNAAWQDAEHKAQQLARLAGAQLDAVLSVSETSNIPPSPLVRVAAPEAGAAVPVEPGTQEVTVSLQVTWLIQGGTPQAGRSPTPSTGSPNQTPSVEPAAGGVPSPAAATTTPSTPMTTVAVTTGASISLNPSSGGADTPVMVQGTGFPPSTPVDIFLAPSGEGAFPQSYARALTDVNGNLSVFIIMPAEWPNGQSITEDSVTVLAAVSEAEVHATAEFRYTAPEGTPVPFGTMAPATVPVRSPTAIPAPVETPTTLARLVTPLPATPSATARVAGVGQPTSIGQVRIVDIAAGSIRLTRNETPNLIVIGPDTSIVTSLDGAARLEDIQPGQLIQITGEQFDGATIQASRIRLLAPDQLVSLRARVGGVVPAGDAITLQGTPQGFEQVSVGAGTAVQAADGSSLELQDLAPGSLIQITGVAGSPGTLVARQITLLSQTANPGATIPSTSSP